MKPGGQYAHVNNIKCHIAFSARRHKKCVIDMQNSYLYKVLEVSTVHYQAEHTQKKGGV